MPEIKPLSFGKINSWSNRFNKANTDGSEGVDINELMKLPDFNKHRADGWMTNMDLDQSGDISQPEWIAFFASRETGIDQQELADNLALYKFGFDFTDTNWDGFNDHSELKALFGDEATDEDIDGFIDNIDQRGKNHPLDRKLDFAEIAFLAIRGLQQEH